MAENDETKKVEEKESPQSKKPIIKWIIIGVLIVALGAGGFVGWRVFMSKDVTENEGNRISAADAVSIIKTQSIMETIKATIRVRYGLFIDLLSNLQFFFFVFRGITDFGYKRYAAR